MSRVIMKEELEESKKKGEKWMAIHGYVYNVASFLSQHPGGEDILLENIGKDATVEFVEVGHSKWATDIMDTLIIGTLHQN